jgi:hypothetical protein
MEYIIKHNESIIDVCLNSTGGLSSWNDIIDLNSLSDWTPKLYDGQVLQVPIIINDVTYQQLQLYPVNNYEPFDTAQIAGLIDLLNGVTPVEHEIYTPYPKKQIYVVSQGETILDVVLNATGSIDNWEPILNINGFTEWNPILFTGQEILIDYLNLQKNNIIQFSLYPLNNDSGINNLYNQVNEIISNFGDKDMETIFKEGVILDENSMKIINLGISGSFTASIPASSWVAVISIKKLSGSPSIKIGETALGSEICDTMLVVPTTGSDTMPLFVDKKYTNTQTLYFTVTGSGIIDLRIDYIPNYN